jgi:hypothetical protein
VRRHIEQRICEMAKEIAAGMRLPGGTIDALLASTFTRTPYDLCRNGTNLGSQNQPEGAAGLALAMEARYARTDQSGTVRLLE